jgi:hypothetical protein
MKKLALIAAAVAVAVAGAAVAIGAGGDSSAPIKTAASVDWGSVPTHRVAVPSTAGKAAAGKVHKAKVAYFESNVLNLPGDGVDGAKGTCPRRYKAINGYFADDTNDVVSIFNSSGTSARKWIIGVRNLDPDTAAKYFLGFVCLKP